MITWEVINIIHLQKFWKGDYILEYIYVCVLLNNYFYLTFMKSLIQLLVELFSKKTTSWTDQTK